MKRNWIEEGWRRFLDRLRKLWGKRTDPGQPTASSAMLALRDGSAH